MAPTRQDILNRLDSLKKVEFIKPTARDLRGPRHLMGRVQRQEDKLYKQRVLNQQKTLKLQLEKMDSPVNPYPASFTNMPNTPWKRFSRIMRRRRLKNLRRVR